MHDAPRFCINIVVYMCYNVPCEYILMHTISNEITPTQMHDIV